MTDWWTGMEARERLLIAVAAGLTVLVVIWQFALVPSLNARGEARANLEDVDRNLSRIQESYMRKRAVGSAAASARPPAWPGPPSQSVTMPPAASIRAMGA